jgi:hypothetical protein
MAVSVLAPAARSTGQSCAQRLLPLRIAASYTAGVADDLGNRVDSVLNRAVVEQLAEQRALRDALRSVESRLEALERSVGDRTASLGSGIQALRDSVGSAEEHTAEIVADLADRQIDLIGLRIDSLSGAVASLQSRFDDLGGARLDGLRDAIAATITNQIEASRDTVLSALVAREQLTNEHLDSHRQAVLSGIGRLTETISNVATAADARADRHLDGVLNSQAQLDERQVARADALRDAVLGAVEAVRESVVGAQEHGDRRQSDRVDRLGESLRSAQSSTADVLSARLEAVRDAVSGAETRVVERVAAEGEVTGALLESLRPSVESIVRSAVSTEVDRAVLDIRAAIADLGRLFVSLADMLQTSARRAEEQRELPQTTTRRRAPAPAKKAATARKATTKSGGTANKSRTAPAKPAPGVRKATGVEGGAESSNGHHDRDADIVDAEVVDLTEVNETMPAGDREHGGPGPGEVPKEGRRLRPLRARRRAASGSAATPE